MLVFLTSLGDSELKAFAVPKLYWPKWNGSSASF